MGRTSKSKPIDTVESSNPTGNSNAGAAGRPSQDSSDRERQLRILNILGRRSPKLSLPNDSGATLSAVVEAARQTAGEALLAKRSPSNPRSLPLGNKERNIGEARPGVMQSRTDAIVRIKKPAAAILLLGKPTAEVGEKGLSKDKKKADQKASAKFPTPEEAAAETLMALKSNPYVNPAFGLEDRARKLPAHARQGALQSIQSARNAEKWAQKHPKTLAAMSRIDIQKISSKLAKGKGDDIDRDANIRIDPSERRAAPTITPAAMPHRAKIALKRQREDDENQRVRGQ